MTDLPPDARPSRDADGVRDSPPRVLTVLECPDPEGAGRFWARLLGLPSSREDGGRVVVGHPGAPQLVLAPLGERSLADRAGRPAAVFLARSRDRLRPSEDVVVEVPVADLQQGADRVLRLGALPVDGSWPEPGVLFSDPAGHHLRLVPSGAPAVVEAPGVFGRYVAIGDSTTEGLVDDDGHGGWRGWADRLAAWVAASQGRPLEYANLAVSGYRLADIHRTQLDRALAMEPDLMTVVGGVNDILGLRPSFAAVEEHLAAMFDAATARGVRVLTFTNPDISRANPLATAVRDRIQTLNETIRRTALAHDVALVDFENVPTASDPRLWGEDRLHVNTVGHLRVAAALAWLLGLPGSSREWTRDLDDQPGEHAVDVSDRPPSGLGSHLQWARRHLAPWVVAGMRGASYRQGSECKRPEPLVVRVEQESPR